MRVGIGSASTALAPRGRPDRRLFGVPLVHVGLTLLCVICSTVAAELLHDMLEVRRVSAVFLTAVLLSAASFGLRPGLLAAVLAFGCYNLLTVEPRYTLRIDTLEEWLNLSIFLTVAMLTGGLAGRVKEEAIQAQLRASTMTALFTASRTLSSMVGEEAIRNEIARLVAHAVTGEAEVIFNGVTWRHGDADVAKQATWTHKELEIEGAHLGVARWRSSQGTPSKEVSDMASLIVELGASALLRAREAALLVRSDLEQSANLPG